PPQPSFRLPPRTSVQAPVRDVSTSRALKVERYLNVDRRRGWRRRGRRIVHARRWRRRRDDYRRRGYHDNRGPVVILGVVVIVVVTMVLVFPVTVTVVIVIIAMHLTKVRCLRLARRHHVAFELLRLLCGRKRSTPDGVLKAEFDGVDGSLTASMCQSWVVKDNQRTGAIHEGS